MQLDADLFDRRLPPNRFGPLVAVALTLSCSSLSMRRSKTAARGPTAATQKARTLVLDSSPHLEKSGPHPATLHNWLYMMRVREQPQIYTSNIAFIGSVDRPWKNSVFGYVFGS